MPLPCGSACGRSSGSAGPVEGTWRLLKHHGWSWQQPTRHAIERDDDAVESGRRRPGRG
ncbi:winged helix-turn-helix domain-containing protein [Kitasatospora sp. NPDC004745]|uniref:helix-turn-helix domain-containing protein n=1 Tax=Kitasatospora sp. NPDC004745 TaxID=3364019 RepID=UPI00368B5A50